MDPAAVIIDAVFGFSFSGTPRAPYDALVDTLAFSPNPVFSIDVPSGWPLDSPPPPGSWSPESVVSLTAPKACMEGYAGRHWLGGRFVPPGVVESFGLGSEVWKGAEKSSHVVDITEAGDGGEECMSGTGDGDQVVAVYVTAPGDEAAETLCSKLLGERAVACCNLSSVSSMYTWKGKVEKDEVRSRKS